MQLKQLRGAIRKSVGNAFVRVSLGPGIPPINLVLQKSALYPALEMAFPQGLAQETGLTFNPQNGQIYAEGTAPDDEADALSDGAYDEADALSDRAYDEADALSDRAYDEADALSDRADDMLSEDDEDDLLL